MHITKSEKLELMWATLVLSITVISISWALANNIIAASIGFTVAASCLYKQVKHGANNE